MRRFLHSSLLVCHYHSPAEIPRTFLLPSSTHCAAEFLLQCELSRLFSQPCSGKSKSTMTTMPGPSLGAGEEILVTAHAAHKKTPGTAWFTTRRALWRAADGRAAVQRAEVPWAAVKSFQVSVGHSSRSSSSWTLPDILCMVLEGLKQQQCQF